MAGENSTKSSKGVSVSRRSFMKGIAAAGAGTAFLASGRKRSDAAVSLVLDGQVAVVTGGGRGIGRGIALTLAQAGADLAIIETDVVDTAFNQYRTKEINGYAHAQKVVEEAKALGRRAMAVKADVSKWNQVQPALNQVIAEMGKVDIWVNNAGVATATLSIEGTPEEEWDQIMNVNIKGVFLCCKAVLPHMKQRNYGRIINVASIAGKKGSAALHHYSASKFAVVGFTQSLADGLMKTNITANAICPGIVWTQMWRLLSELRKKPEQTAEEWFASFVKVGIPQGRAQTPEDMGRLALYFATNPDVTGQSINVCGGMQIVH